MYTITTSADIHISSKQKNLKTSFDLPCVQFGTPGLPVYHTIFTRGIRENSSEIFELRSFSITTPKLIAVKSTRPVLITLLGQVVEPVPLPEAPITDPYEYAIKYPSPYCTYFYQVLDSKESYSSIILAIKIEVPESEPVQSPPNPVRQSEGYPQALVEVLVAGN